VIVRLSIALVSICLFLATPATAQDFGVLESAETINEGNFKLGAYPLFVLPDFGDNDFGVAVAVGYGFTDSFDLEGRATFSDDVIYVGADGEYWFLKNQPLDMSLRAGIHFGGVEGEVGDSAGVDLTLLASAPVGGGPVELIGALDMAFNSMDVGADRERFTTVHLVPGVEIALSPDVDFLAEFGIGVNDDSSNYFGLGVALYIR
jgi:hypothetical protein